MATLRKYSREEIAWLAAGYLRWRAKDLAERYAAHWGRPIAVGALRDLMRRHGHSSGRPPGIATGERWTVWSPDMIAWLRRYRPWNTLADTADQFNAYYGLGRSRYAIDGACQRNGIQRREQTTFAPGDVPWNKGLIGYQAGGAAAAYRFRPGAEPWTEVPVWTYVKQLDGYWKLKVRDKAGKGETRKDWIECHRLTWQGTHGPIPLGHVVVLLDGDPDQCLDPDNLACISRAALVRLNQLRWDALIPDRDLRRAAVTAAELFVAAHDAGKAAGMGSHRRRALIGVMGAFG
jgi:hypothetical protein